MVASKVSQVSLKEISILTKDNPAPFAARAAAKVAVFSVDAGVFTRTRLLDLLDEPTEPPRRRDVVVLGVLLLIDAGCVCVGACEMTMQA